MSAQSTEAKAASGLSSARRTLGGVRGGHATGFLQQAVSDGMVVPVASAERISRVPMAMGWPASNARLTSTQAKRFQRSLGRCFWAGKELATAKLQGGTDGRRTCQRNAKGTPLDSCRKQWGTGFPVDLGHESALSATHTM